MLNQNLEYLYAQYKSCLKKELDDYLGKSDSYKSYITQCENQRDDIIEFVKDVTSKTEEFNQTFEYFLEEKVEEYSFKMARYGYETKLARNM